MSVNRIEKTRLKLLQEGKEIVNLSSGVSAEMELRFPQEILKDGFEKFLLEPGYKPDPKGDLKAREAVASFYRERNFEVDPEQILLTSGTSESYFHLFKLLAKLGDGVCSANTFDNRPREGGVGDEILFPNPGYPLFDHLAQMAEVQLRHYELDPAREWQVNVQDLAAKITSRTKAIVLISPNNPTGGVLSEENLLEVIEVAQRHQLPIISDEVFAEFMFDGKIFPRVANLAKKLTVFTLNGVSKTYNLPGLKVGWIIASGPDWRARIEALEIFTDTFLACSQISQTLLPLVIADGSDFLEGYRKRVEANRNMAMEILGSCKKLRFMKPVGGFYLFAEIQGVRSSRSGAPPLSDEDFVIELMKETGIFVHPGYFYDYEKGIHILICYLMEGAKLRIYLEQLVKFIENLGSDNN